MTWLLLAVSLSHASPLGWIRNRLHSPDPSVVDARARHLAKLEYVPEDRREGLDRVAALAWARANGDLATLEMADKIEALSRSATEEARVDQRFFALHAQKSVYGALFARYLEREGAPLTFERVFAPHLARFEARLARRWGADLERVQAFVEHALPGEGPRAPRRLWAAVLDDDPGAAKRLAFSARRKRQMIREAQALPPELGGLLFANVPPGPRRTAIAAHLGFTFDEAASPLRFGFPKVESDVEAIAQYRGALDAFDRMRGRLYRLEPSPMKDALYRDVATLYHEAVDELAQLPLRRNPPAALATVPLGDAAWWNFGVAPEDRPAPLAEAWVKVLNESGQRHVAAMINLNPPPGEATCADDFAKGQPQDDTPQPPWTHYGSGSLPRRFGPEMM